MTDFHPRMNTATAVDIIPGVDLEITTIRRKIRNAFVTEYTALVAIDRRGLLRRDYVWNDTSEIAPHEAWERWLKAHRDTN